MKIANPERRLERFWGRVDQKHIGLISEWVRGPSVLEVGCGYGTLIAHISSQGGIEATGVDSDESVLKVARHLFPGGDFRLADAASLPFVDEAFSTIVLRDTLHHLVNDST